MKDDIEVLNGRWFKNDELLRFVQWIDEDQYVFLSNPRRAIHGGTILLAISDRSGKVIFTEAEIRHQLKAERWQPVDMMLKTEEHEPPRPVKGQEEG